MNKENQSNENTTPESDAAEVKNPAALLAKNKQLLAKLAESNAALKTAQDALGVAQASATDWQAKWHKATVLDALDAELKAVSAAPLKYIEDSVKRLGLLKMQADEDGFERPLWLDEKGEPADLSNGLYKFLCGVSDRAGKDHELGRVLRPSGISGYGTISSKAHTPERSAQSPALNAPMPLGLR
jgi:hypothetical protein